MIVIGTVFLAIALCIIAANLVILYILLIPKKPKPRRKIQRTIYGKDWDRILEMTKIEKTKRK